MLTLRKSEDRGHFDHGWLNTYHSFSFDQYQDPKHMGFRSLRVINEDFVAAGEGFPTHGHRDMEIVTYVLEGELSHRDSLGNGSKILPGDVQRMSAGKGIRHSEFNSSKERALHLLQIWILPSMPGLAPGYEQKFFEPAEKTGRLRLVASPDGAQGSVTIHQDARIYAAITDGKALVHELARGRGAWIQVARGQVTVNGTELETGDGVAIEDELGIRIEGPAGSEFLLFDLN